MRAFRFVTVDVFTERRFGGNPLAVFPDARGLSGAEMQALAAEFNLSETTFVLPPDSPHNNARVRIFNRTEEMPFAGHPNVGTAFVLGREDEEAPRAYRFEEPAGLVEVTLERDAGGRVTGADVAAPQPLSLGGPVAAATIAACAGLPEAAVLQGTHPPIEASVGNPFVIAEVAPEALSQAAPDLAAFQRARAAHPGMGGRFALYLHARGEGAMLRARMFAPLSGTWEDAATGSAASTLAALLLSAGGGAEGRWRVGQGVEMGRPSVLEISARRLADGIRATVGGRCVPVLRGEAVL
jgi:trans-2,3-dihydro-3-hydroxyanthranilate isomerase